MTDEELPEFEHSSEVHTDPPAPEGPGGVDAVPDWEAAEPDAPTPDQPQAAQMKDEQVPDEIQAPESTDDGEGADDDAAERPERDEPA